MTSLFISHSSGDGPFADALFQRLSRLGYADVFLSRNPEAGLVPGEEWERQLYEALARVDAVIYIATRASSGSKWCFAELCLARSLGKKIVPILREPDALPRELAPTQGVPFLASDGADPPELGVLGTSARPCGVATLEALRLRY